MQSDSITYRDVTGPFIPYCHGDVVPVPDDLFRLANRDVVVRACLALWQTGQVTWEQALMVAVLRLSEQNEKLGKLLFQQAQHAPQPLIVPCPPATSGPTGA